MSTTHITPTTGRIVWYRGKDGMTRAAIVAFVNGPFNVNLYVFGLHAADPECGPKDSVTHADPEQEPGCYQSWHWMPYQKQQAEKHAQADQLAAHAAMVKESGWKPSDTSDAAIEQQIQAKGKTAPRVTPADIEANIAHEVYFTAEQGVIGARLETGHYADTPRSLGLLTFCVLTLRNGFTVTGESACASPENFDVGIGREIARANAVNKIWPLTSRLGAAHAGYSTMQPHQQRVVDEKAELDERLEKLVAFSKTPVFAGLDSAERNRLSKQAEAMTMYSHILFDRIAAFAPAADVTSVPGSVIDQMGH
jgi:hypothetical protein